MLLPFLLLEEYIAEGGASQLFLLVEIFIHRRYNRWREIEVCGELTHDNDKSTFHQTSLC